MKFSLEKKLGIAFGCALGSIVALGLLQFYTLDLLKENHQSVAYTEEVLRELESTRNELNRADATVQSFEITGDASYVARYEQSTISAREHLRNLHNLTVDNTGQQVRLAKLEKLAQESVRALQDEVEARKTGPVPPQTLLPLENQIRRTSAAAREMIDDMQIEESELLEQRREAVEKSNQRSNSLIFFGSLIAFLLLGAAGTGLYFDIAERRRAERTLRENEQRFRLLISGVRDYAIFFLTPDGYVGSWNQEAERITGYRPLEILGKHFSCFFTDEDRWAGVPARELETVRTEGRLERQGWRVRKDGSLFWAEASLAALRTDEGRLYGFAKIARDATDRRKAHEALQQANRELEREVADRRQAESRLQESERSLRELSLHLLRSQDEERRRMGRELHDSLGQYLALAKITLDSLRSGGKVDEEAIAEKAGHCAGLVEEAIKEVRTISYLLYSPMLEEMGLGAAVPWYVEGFSKRSGIKTTVEIPSNFERLPAAVEMALYRVLQESLTNVHRHSGSSSAQVRIQREPEHVILEVRDQGRGLGWPGSGFAVDTLGPIGVGLRGMSERLKELRGALEIQSDERGTTVRAIVPCSESMSAASRLNSAASV